MSEAVIDGFEIVEIDEKHRSTIGSRLTERTAEKRAIGEPGETVMIRLIANLLFQFSKHAERSFEMSVLQWVTPRSSRNDDA